jgi:hypothetical protein
MDDQLLTIQELIDSATSSLKTARNMLSEFTGVADPTKLKHTAQASVQSSVPVSDGKIIEGIFDGQNMVDPEGQTYPVPANYASKSKLVEGDGMKLTITDEGKFVYKQINPVDRRMVGGVLIQEDGQYKILSEGKSYRVLLASVTFYRAEVGDQVTIILPKDDDAIWGAVENVMPKHVAETEAKAQIAKEVDGELMPDLDE